jgi:hypothetical protein
MSLMSVYQHGNTATDPQLEPPVILKLTGFTEEKIRELLSKTVHSLVLRTDFSDDASWYALRAAINEPNEDGFEAWVDYISDPAYDGLTVAQLVALASKGDDHTFVFIADRTTLTTPEQPVLVVDLRDEPVRTIRCIPREMWRIENNLAMENRDFNEFASRVDLDGVFRGFRIT